MSNAGRGLMLGNIASAAFLCGLGLRLIRDTSEHAGTRKQFGRALGEFQAVTHPLADCVIAITAAQHLARAAACRFDAAADSGPDEVRQTAAGALLSSRRAALQTAFTCHQVFGAIGVTLEGPAFHITRRIRQVASQPPAGAREQNIVLAAAGMGD